MVPVSAAEVCGAIKRLELFMCIGLDDIPSFIIKGCSDICVPLLMYTFNLSAASVTFPSLWKQTAVTTTF
jgi:hypothetical protein